MSSAIPRLTGVGTATLFFQVVEADPSKQQLVESSSFLSLVQGQPSPDYVIKDVSSNDQPGSGLVWWRMNDLGETVYYLGTLS